MRVGEIFGLVIALFFLVYIAFLLTQNFCQQTPSYCSVGWTVFGALVIGVVAFLKVGLFGSKSSGIV